MALLDINVALGRFAQPIGGSFDNADALQAELKRLGISEALVYHALAAEGDIMMGNELLLEALAGHDNLYHCWVMAPSYLGDLPDPETWVNTARERGVHAVRMIPRHSLYPLEDWCVGPLLRELEAAEIPLLLDYGIRQWPENIIPWGNVKSLADRYPQLNIVILGVTVGDARAIDGLLYSTENVSFEFSAFIPPDMFEHVAGAGFADSFLFGTGLPRRAAECVVAQTLTAGIDRADWELMAGGNARRLLRIDPFENATPPLPVEATRSPVPVIDMHGHCGSWDRTTTPLKSPAAFIQSMDRCGIDTFVVSSFAAIHGETRAGNHEASEWVAEYPDRLYAYVVVNPNDPEGSLADLTRYLRPGSNFVGLKLHCYLHGAQLHDHGYAKCLSFANENDLPILVHGGGQDDWDGMCLQYPNANFIMAHACLWNGVDREGPALYERVRSTPNLYVDICGSAAYRGSLRKLIDLVGADKVLYGSDFPMFDFAWELGRVTLAEVSDEEKRLICGDNARRIYKRLQTRLHRPR
ncbi:MAG: amidohydrolase family protein [Candidatus Hydrogenedentes bacterium]|nr:amidohydrolase family protein [Candidatus Hydrogenedentota bacterium]